jgi:hypothetical protein
MSLDLDTKVARQADRTNSAIRNTGKYVGVITRAEKLLSKSSTEGLGISFKTDDGATANYLDLYTKNSKGDILPSMATVQAILCCTKTKQALEGEITFEKWDKDAGQVIKAKANGYPSLIGKRIGFLLQQELSTNNTNGADVDRVVIYGVFEAETELTASEILDQKTQPEKLGKMLEQLMARPINDRRANKSSGASFGSNVSHAEDFETEIPF